MKNTLFFILQFFLLNSNAQNVTNFISTDFYGLSGLTIDQNYLYVVSSNGVVLKKEISSLDSTNFETYNIGGSGYRANA